jgi:hypothetical protein
VIFNIRGAHGAGKTTLARGLVSSIDNPQPLASQRIHSPTKKNPDRHLTKVVTAVSGVHNSLILGSYRSGCAGCDEFSWKGAHDAIVEGIEHAAELVDHVIYEGAIISGIWKRYVQLTERIWDGGQGQRTCFVFLQPPLQTCIERVAARGGKPVDDPRMIKNVSDKWNTCQKQIEELEHTEYPGLGFVVFTDSRPAEEFMLSRMQSS